MIKVMQHYENGGEIEFKRTIGYAIKWEKLLKTPDWDWYTYNYRIKEPKQKVTIEKWLVQNTTDKIYSIIESSNVDKYKHYEKIKLIESYEVEL